MPGDDGHHFHTAGQLDNDLRVDRAMRKLLDFAFENIASADFHGAPPRSSLIFAGQAGRWWRMGYASRSIAGFIQTKYFVRMSTNFY